MECFWLCEDCVFAHAYEDHSAVSLYCTADESEQRLALMAPEQVRLLPISADFNAEEGLGIIAVSESPCDACGSRRCSQRCRFTRL
ncbi:hypothetical protein [Pseudomonas sp. 25 R 14]|uniref:hypothetical protein n=1 Tax=Pseudomonas sp. 25 R 14 TaxID=1844109 RepID=UPI0008120849|nr:hypothetical protein [Pseudomonas sp. 25 R 14]CRM57210.1 hypothetical protein [Pseudomonas sp. 25 R 14]